MPIFGFKTILLVKLFSKVETNTSEMSTTERRPASDSKSLPLIFDLQLVEQKEDFFCKNAKFALFYSNENTADFMISQLLIILPITVV